MPGKSWRVLNCFGLVVNLTADFNVRKNDNGDFPVAVDRATVRLFLILGAYLVFFNLNLGTVRSNCVGLYC